jgi:hypothetical protein
MKSAKLCSLSVKNAELRRAVMESWGVTPESECFFSATVAQYMNPSRLAIRPVGSPEAGQVRPPLLSDLQLELNKGDTVPRANCSRHVLTLTEMLTTLVSSSDALSDSCPHQ